MGSDHWGDGIGCAGQLFFAEIEQLAGGKLETIAGSQQAFFEGPGAHLGIAIGQHGQTDHRMPMNLFQSVVIMVHALGETGIRLGLDLDVH